MKNLIGRFTAIFLLTLAILLGCSNAGKDTLLINRDQNFDLGWKFMREDVAGVELPGFDDSSWRTLDLPHDWSIEALPGPDDENKIGPFSKSSPGTTSTGYVIGGTGWYRKAFTIDPKDKNKLVQIMFDGVYMESDVWVNGKHVGFHPYGYSPFYYDLTPFLHAAGEQNVIAVRVNNPGKNSRWYSGSGIYRHVSLSMINPVYVSAWGVAVTTPEVSAEEAKINLKIDLENASGSTRDVLLRTKLIDSDGKVAAKEESKISIERKISLNQEIEIKSPKLWSTENPNLYKAQIDLVSDGVLVDQYLTTFGIRSIEFSAADGFKLNGEKMELRGACMHHDNGLLGSAAFARAEERRVEIMKANGYNAIRTSHNPPSIFFLNACDRLGMLAIDEAFDMWEQPKNSEDYHRYFKEWYKKDLESMLLRDRNHPAVIMWSVGNEIHERADTSGVRIAKDLAGIIKNLDPARPVNAAICGFWDHPGREWDASVPAFEHLDVGGYNYQWMQYESDHEKYPGRIMVGTESIAMEAFENWQQVLKHPYVIGDFIWTGMDYLGETGIGHVLPDNEKERFAMEWPWYNSWCGDIDICGNKKPQSYFRDVVWGLSPLEMAVHKPLPEGRTEKPSYWGWPDEYSSWTWPGEEGKPLQVSVYSNCDSVRLELNGQIIGEQPVSAKTKLTTKFSVPYVEGELKAIGLIDGTEVATKTLRTAGAPKQLRVLPDRQEIRADRGDLCFVTVEALDESGNLAPNVAVPVAFSLTGNGEILTAGNAAPDDMHSFGKRTVKTYNGRCMAILRPMLEDGTMELTAEAEGIEPVKVLIEVKGQR